MYFSKSIANGTKLLDAAIQIKVLHSALLGADKMVPVLDEALISASKVFSVTAVIVRNQIYASNFMKPNYFKFWDANKLLPVLDAA